MTAIAMIGRMTETQYSRERAELGPTKRAAGVRWEQELALLFVRSGWTQEELAAKEAAFTGKKISRQHITRLLQFGRFLNNAPMGANPETMLQSLTERRFRDYWDRTDKCGGNERQRFAQVLTLMRAGQAHTPHGFPKRIVAQFGDGKWHSLPDIAEYLEADEEDVKRSLAGMIKDGRGNATTEMRKYGTTWQYRIFPKEGKPVSRKELIEKLTPIIKDLKAQGNCNMATMSPASVAILASRLQKLLDEWTE